MTKLHAGEILSPEICRKVDRAIETIIRREFRSFHQCYAEGVKRYYARKGKDADFEKFARVWIKRVGSRRIAEHLEHQFCDGTSGEFGVLICGLPPGSQCVIRFNSAGGRSWWNAYSWEIAMKALSHALVRSPYRDPGVTRYY